MARLATALALVAAAQTTATTWNVVSKGVAGASLGIAAYNASTLFLAGDAGSVGQAAWVAKSEDGGVEVEKLAYTLLICTGSEFNATAR